MNDYIITDFDVLQQSYNNETTFLKNPTCLEDFTEARTGSHYSSLQTAMGQEFQTHTNFPTDSTGLEYLDYSRWCRDLQVGGVNKTIKLPIPGQETPSSDSGALKKVEQHTLTRSYELLQKLQESKLNLILVATSLDENEVIQKLENTLDPRTCRMIPLTFKDDQMSEVDVSKILGDVIPGESKQESTSTCNEPENSSDEDSEHNTQNSKRMFSKRKHGKGKDEKYWRRRNKNNEAAKRSREARRARFVWIETRTKELEVENARLHEQLKAVQKKVSELQRRISK